MVFLFNYAVRSVCVDVLHPHCVVRMMSDWCEPDQLLLTP